MDESGGVEKVGRAVQELVLKADNVPKNYMYDEGGCGFGDALMPSEDDGIPVLDLLRLSSSSSAQQELPKLHRALHSWGCFQVSLSISSKHNLCS